MTGFARAAFVLLISATLAAFFISQRVKSAPAVVEVTKQPARFYSPLAPGARAENRFTFRLKRADEVTVAIVNPDGDAVRTLLNRREVKPYRLQRVAWDGRTSAGNVVPDGRYKIRISLRHEGRSVTVPRSIELKTSPPRPKVLSVKPDVIGPGAKRVRVRVQGVSRRHPTSFRVVRTDLTPMQVVATFTAPKGQTAAYWDGKVNGSSARPGTYMIVPRVQDRAGNVGSTPAHIPPRAGEVVGRGGVTVRRLAIAPPLEPVPAGTQTTFFVDSRGRDYRWSIRRVGSSRPVKRGRARGGKPLNVQAPRGISGPYMFEVHTSRDRAGVPFLVQSQQRAGLLVLTPTMTWVGEDLVDDVPRDGLPNSLALGESVQLSRVIQGVRNTGMPAGFANKFAPLTIFLNRTRIRYDLATDIAAATGKVNFKNYRGVVLAAPFRWIPRSLAVSLRRYVREGGRVAVFGAGTLRRGVTLKNGVLSEGTLASNTDALGVRLAETKKLDRSANLISLKESEKAPLLTGTNGVLSGFTAVEESVGFGPDARSSKSIVEVGVPVTDAQIAKAEAAGDLAPTPVPAIAAIQQGKGLLIRVGIPEWNQRISRNRTVAQITHNILDILRGEIPRTRSPL